MGGEYIIDQYRSAHHTSTDSKQDMLAITSKYLYPADVAPLDRTLSTTRNWTNISKACTGDLFELGVRSLNVYAILSVLCPVIAHFDRVLSSDSVGQRLTTPIQVSFVCFTFQIFHVHPYGIFRNGEQYAYRIISNISTVSNNSTSPIIEHIEAAFKK